MDGVYQVLFFRASTSTERKYKEARLSRRRMGHLHHKHTVGKSRIRALHLEMPVLLPGVFATPTRDKFTISIHDIYKQHK
jgi:hypothetical protein